MKKQQYEWAYRRLFGRGEHPADRLFAGVVIFTIIYLTIKIFI